MILLNIIFPIGYYYIMLNLCIESAYLVADEFPLKLFIPQNEQHIAGFTVLAVLPIQFI